MHVGGGSATGTECARVKGQLLRVCAILLPWMLGGRTKVNRLEQQNKCFYPRNFPVLLLKTGLLLKLEFTELARAAGRQAPKDPPVSAP